jgi:methyl-accepting chemotaxis protein
MQMDETTQQNAALVEETTSASQSMKDQAKELMSQMDVFVVNSSGGHTSARNAAPAARTATKPGITAAKPVLKKPTFSSKSADAKPVGVAAGNGHDRHKKDDDFEEF